MVVIIIIIIIIIRLQQLTVGAYYVLVTIPGSKWIKYLTVRIKTVKLWEENIGGNFYDLGFGNSFLKNMTPKYK